MIVDPDFFDHWKTLLLVDALGDEKAPLYVLRLWAHCQNRKRSSFDSLSPRALKALCRYSGHADKLLSGLTESGFVTVDDGGRLEVCGWDEYNAKLVANWVNGSKGGRPKKPDYSPDGTQEKPNGNPKRTQPKPNGNPPGTHAEPIREDRRREEKNKEPPNPQGGTRVSCEYSIEFETWWANYPRRRRSKKQQAYRKWKTVTKTADAEMLISRVRDYAKSPQGQSEFAVLPTVWLNSGMWEDDPVAWQRKADSRKTNDELFHSIPKVG